MTPPTLVFVPVIKSSTINTETHSWNGTISVIFKKSENCMTDGQICLTDQMEY